MPGVLFVATALSAFSIWVVVSMVETKGRSLLLSFVVIAGFFSAWFSLHHPQFAGIRIVVQFPNVAWHLFSSVGMESVDA
jgi:hypothetical protein